MTTIARTLYTCGRCQFAEERYRAFGNVPKHAHLCTACYEEDPNREHYERVVLARTIVPEVGMRVRIYPERVLAVVAEVSASKFRLEVVDSPYIIGSPWIDVEDKSPMGTYLWGDVILPEAEVCEVGKKD